jgi:hypothetical protein
VSERSFRKVAPGGVPAAEDGGSSISLCLRGERIWGIATEKQRKTIDKLEQLFYIIYIAREFFSSVAKCHRRLP